MATKRPRKIEIYFQERTPESVENGDYSAQGHDETEEVDDDDEDFDGIAYVAEFLRAAGGVEPSNTQWQKGTWYCGPIEVTDYRTGTERELTYHLHGFESHEEVEIFDRVTKKG